MKCVIHAGKHKTGTTSLQHLLNENKDLLLEHGIVYPSAGNAPHHNFILDPFNHNYDTNRLAAIVDYAERSSANMIFMSAEVVSTLPPKGLQHIVSCFSACESITLIVSLRHWASFLPSRYVQSCKRRDSHTYASYLSKISDPARNHWDFYFDAALEQMLESDCAVKIISYDHAIQAEGIISAVLDCAGITELIGGSLIQSSKLRNQAPPWQTVELLRLLNGAASNRLQQPDNPLFDLLAHGSRNSEGYSLFDFDQKLNRLDPGMIANCERWIEQNGEQPPEIPAQCSCIEDRIMSTFGPLVVNAVDGRLFPTPPITPPDRQVTSSTWEEFAAWNPAIVDQLLNQLLQLTSRPIEARQSFRTKITNAGRRLWRKALNR